MRFARVSLTHVFPPPLSDAIGHNNPRRLVQVVGDSLHDVLRVRLGQPHISCRPGPEPLVHRTICPVHGKAHLAYGLVHALSRSVRLRFFCALCMMRPFSLMEESAFLFSDES